MMRQCALLVAGVFFINACSEQGDPALVQLAGGEVAKPGQFPAAMYFSDCSATKIGPRHILTAAHCVVENYYAAIDEKFLPGKKVAFYSGVWLSSATRFSLEIENVLISGEYAGLLTQARSLSSSARESFIKKNKSQFADVALIIVKDDASQDMQGFSKILAAEIDTRNIRKGDTLVATGFGCERIITEFDDFLAAGDNEQNHLPDARLKFASFNFTNISPTEYSYMEEDYTDPKVGICFGDSGGGLYLSGSLKIKGKAQNIVGIGVAQNRISATEYWTRLDSLSLERAGICINNVIKRNALFDFDGIKVFCSPE